MGEAVCNWVGGAVLPECRWEQGRGMKPYAICYANSSVDDRIFDAFGFDR